MIFFIHILNLVFNLIFYFQLLFSEAFYDNKAMFLTKYTIILFIIYWATWLNYNPQMVTIISWGFGPVKWLALANST